VTSRDKRLSDVSVGVAVNVVIVYVTLRDRCLSDVGVLSNIVKVAMKSCD